MANRASKPHARRLDDSPVRDISLAIWGYPAFLVAHEMRLLDLLAENPRTLAEVCEAKGIERRPAEALLALCASLGLVERRGERYAPTRLSRNFLVESSPIYFGHFFDGMLQLAPLFSVDAVRRAVRTNKPQSDLAESSGDDAFKGLGWQNERAKMFTRAMHSLSVAPALAWPERVNLSRNRVMLDIGGGSGAHSIRAVLRWPQLRAVVFDAPPVCEVAEEFVAGAGLSRRITTHAGDFFNDPFPRADLHFYSMIFHDWPAEQCRLLAKKSFDALPEGGRIVLHEILFNDDRTGPFAAAAFNINMLVMMTGEQYSGREISAFLSEAGFERIQVRPTLSYWSVVTAVKP